MCLVWQQQVQRLVAGKRSRDELVETQAARISQIQEQNARQEQEVGRLQAALRALEDRSRELGAAGGRAKEELRAVSEQRDGLTQQLQQAEQSYQSLKFELTNLRAEHDRALLHTASLEARIGELTAASRDQERRLVDAAPFLSSAADPGEPLGARNLHSAH